MLLTRITPPLARHIGVLLLLTGALHSLAVAAANDTPREHLSLDSSWKFSLNESLGAGYGREKGGYGSPAATRMEFNDLTWRTINLPHDWAVELPFDKTATRNGGFKPIGSGFAKNNFGWYRRSLTLPSTDAGKRIYLQFDGAMHDATVWVNGWVVKRHEGGYEQFREDITDIVNLGGSNIITVRVDATHPEGWFYEGAGLYRHVWLIKTAPVAIAPNGVFVYSSFKNNIPADQVEVLTETTVLNSLPAGQNGRVRLEVFNPAGQSVAKAEKAFALPGSAHSEVKESLFFEKPALWSPESPKLHHLVTTVEVDGKVVDRQKTEFGIRTVAFDKDRGFLLNGQPYKIKGTVNHQNHAGVGAAMPDALQYFRVAKLKECGSNAYRTGHYPPTPELLEACDRLGMLVMTESRLLGSDSENLSKLEAMIRLYRNHPSVMIWSICNEEPRQDEPVGGRVALSMQALVKRLDPTRAVTAGSNLGNTSSGLMGLLDVRGFNYNDNAWDKYHAEKPEQPILGTEMASYVSTRGIYEHDKDRCHVASYGPYRPRLIQELNSAPRLTEITTTWWSLAATRPWFSGGFIWTGFDYRGEPSPFNWPCINSAYGILDTCGFPKDDFYYYKAWWTANPVLHLLPHWNWAGKDGQEILVQALSNCEQVELFLNGRSLGKQKMEPYSRLSWKVKYAPGTLSAKGFVGDKMVKETKVETTGAASTVQLTPDRARIAADGADISIVTVAVADAQKRVVPTVGNKITFALNGPGKIIGVGNGDPSCLEPDTYFGAPTVKSIASTEWRWKQSKVPASAAVTSDSAGSFADPSWLKIPANNSTEFKRNDTVIMRTHITLTKADLESDEVLVSVAGIPVRPYQEKTAGWLVVNQQFVGETTGKNGSVFNCKSQLRVGENVIVWSVNHYGRDIRFTADNSGFNPKASVELITHPAAPVWSRSVFNGLAQIIVQSTGQAGEIKLTASAEGLQPVTTLIVAQPKTP
jgi:beta-galactosidase